VVLNLFVEWAPTVVIESVTISIFTAIALNALLDLIIGFEHRVNAFFKERDQRILEILATLLISFLSKFVILEAVGILFGGNVELDGFFMIVALIIVMMASRAIVQVIYHRLGHDQEPVADTP
jgi:hypothetical protein